MTDETSIHTLTRKDAAWPTLLSELPERDIPKTLFVRGTLPPNDAYMVAIVGTRHPTRDGEAIASAFARDLAHAGIIVVSGMAIGIDTAAHRGALDAGGRTIAVLGSGIDEPSIYPRMNVPLARRITEQNGAVISEYTPGTKAAAWTFPARNRIIAGLAKGVVVIEAAEKSGALITARYGLEYGREVLAVPGAITHDVSKGTNALLKRGATPVTEASDILEALGIETPNAEHAAKNLELPENALRVLETLTEPRTVDEIVKIATLPKRDVFATLSLLELEGLISARSDGTYTKPT